MQIAPSNLHVYQRDLSLDASNSLGRLAQWIAPGARVLDLGCGAGGLGQLLRPRGTDRIDGITYNPAEAEVARQWYQHVAVADLDQCELTTLLGEQRYDVIVCADVLEHLRSPERLLAQCRRYLAPGGQLLASIPNAGHAGLIGELMGGRLQYRDEGLLDRTHLRFFTRRSWLDFLAEQGWGATRLEGIQRDVPQTEFEVAFDMLPPAVSHYLCALPDALTYQFITACIPGVPHSPALQAPVAPLPPSFGTTLYWDQGQGYQEAQKLQISGVMGQAFQTLHYPLPTQAGLCGLRLDPSDRPGFMRWHRLELFDATGQRVWEADCQQIGAGALANCALHQISLAPALDAHSGLLSVLQGDDPWLELPRALPWPALVGGTLQVSLGWPASTDYLALLEHLHQLQPSAQELARLREAWSIDHAHTQQLEQQLRAMEREWQHEHGQAVSRHERLQALQAEHDHTLQALQQSQEALRHCQQAQQAAQAHPLRRLLRLAKRSLRPAAAQRATEPAPPVPGSEAPPRPAKVAIAPPDEARSPASAAAATAAPALLPTPLAPTVDIIVPVYRGLSDTRQCLESVLAHRQTTPTRLIVINDCSPEPELSDWLRQWAAAHPEVTLLENETNLGFVATVNRGMALSETHDVLLLNSDTEVANDWLDRMRRTAYSAPRVSSVTPFSNNATICSYPRFCEANDLPEGLDTAALDQMLARHLSGQTVDIPTAIGFCMYIRRDCLQAVGLFDVEHFGKGYGEENDFCCRASAAGWRHLHALDTFVLHRGGVSFGDSKNERERAALRTLRRLHPGYEAEVQRFVQADPARPARQQIDLLRLQATGRPKVLAVSHNAAGGTLQHIRELAALLAQQAQQADFLLLRPYEGGLLKLSCVDPREGYLETFQLPGEAQALRDRLAQLGVVLVHYHHLLDHGSEVLNLPRDLGVPADFTAHDYYTLCPQVSLVDANGRYCSELGPSQCAACLEERPAPDHKTIEVWRRDHRTILQRMRHVLAPSVDTAHRMHSFVPQANLRLAPHPDLPMGQALPNPNPKPLPAGARLKVAVIGALNPLKGADLLEQTALLAARQGAAIDFHLLGHAYRDLSTQPRAHLSVHGRYQNDDLPALLSWLKPDLVWFPVQAPETYSYTLSACLQAGLPIVAPDLGAFPARLVGRPWTWIQAWDTDAAGWLGVFQALMEQHFSTGQPPSLPWLASSQFDVLRLTSFDYQNEYLPGPTTPENAPGTMG